MRGGLDGFQVLGWAAQSFFFSRFLVQWIASERAAKPVAPRVFWWLSGAGSALMVVYTLSMGQPGMVLLVGQLANLGIYSRNLWFAYRGGRGLSPPLAAACGIAVGLAFALSGAFQPKGSDTVGPLWLTVGIIGQCIFSSRFIVQWWKSERSGTSHFPVSFWWLSLVGNAILMSYAIHLRDAVYIAGFSIGPLVQVRNLMLHRRERAREQGAA